MLYRDFANTALSLHRIAIGWGQLHAGEPDGPIHLCMYQLLDHNCFECPIMGYVLLLKINCSPSSSSKFHRSVPDVRSCWYKKMKLFRR
jgi:hypothetical protein